MTVRTRKVVALSYYHPWFGGGAHRPRQLMVAHRAQGTDVDFVFSSPTGLDDVRSALRRDALSQGKTYHLAAPDNLVRIGVAPELDEPVSTRAVLSFGREEGYVQVHNPAVDLLPMFYAAKSAGIATVYDQMDYWSGFAVQPWGGAEVEYEYLRAADVVITITQELAALQPQRRRPHVVPNGVNDAFVETLRARPPRPSAGRRALYIGAMWPDWFDWELTLGVVDAARDVGFTFIGAIEATPDENDGRPIREFAKRLCQAPNVTLIEEVPHEDIVGHLADADIGLVPFVVNAVTHACSPLKVFEYLAAGLPVVSTPLHNLVGLPGMHLAEKPAEWIAAIESALADGTDPVARAERVTFGESNTWSARARAFDRIVRGVL